MKSIETIAKAMYAAYLAEYGERTFNGDKVPTWSGLGKRRQKCWIAAAQAAHKEITEVH